MGPNIFAKLFSNVKEKIYIVNVFCLSPACSVSPLFSDVVASCPVLLPLVLASPHPHWDPSFSGLHPFLIKEASSAGRREPRLISEHRAFRYPTYFVFLVELFL